MTNDKAGKKTEYIGFKDCFATTTLSFTNAITGVMMSSMLMVYMTEYSGISYASILATVLLMAARIIDAVDDPIQGFIIDSSKRTKIGKYKPFFLISIIMESIGAIALFAIPNAIIGTPAVLIGWVILFYLIYDIGSSFYKDILLYRTMSTDENQRTKLAIGPRLMSFFTGIVANIVFTVAIIALNAGGMSYHDAAGRVIFLLVISTSVISLIGWFMVKEKHYVEQNSAEKLKIKDFFDLFRENKAMVIFALKGLFAGFIWTLIFATPTYYIKWGFCADLTTGIADMNLFAVYSGISSVITVVPMVLGALLGRPLLKLFKDPVKMTCTLLTIQSIGGCILFIAQITGLLQRAPWLFFLTMFIMATGVGTDFVPQTFVQMEVVDYGIYKTGKDRSALTTVTDGFITKMQTAFSTAIVGIVLTSIGYVVEEGNRFAGDVSQIPTMLNWFIVIMGLIPAILGVISVLIYRKYPITNQIRQEMKTFFERNGK